MVASDIKLQVGEQVEFVTLAESENAALEVCRLNNNSLVLVVSTKPSDNETLDPAMCDAFRNFWLGIQETVIMIVDIRSWTLPILEMVHGFANLLIGLNELFLVYLQFTSLIMSPWISAPFHIAMRFYTPSRPVSVMADPMGCFLPPPSSLPGFQMDSAIEAGPDD